MYKIKQTSTIRHGSRLLLLAVFLLLGNSAAYAVLKTSTGSGSWGTAATWSPSGIPATTDDVVIAAGHTVSLAANVTVSSLTVDGTLSRGIRSLTTGSLSGASTGIITSTNGSLIVNGATSTTYAGKLSGSTTSNQLRKTGTSTLTLSGVSDFTDGAIDITTGTLKIGIANALPAIADFTIYNGGIFDLNGFSQTIGELQNGFSSSNPATPGAIVTNSSATAATLTVGTVGLLGSGSYESIVNGNLNLVIQDNFLLSGSGVAVNVSVITGAELSLGYPSSSAALSGDLSVASGSTVRVDNNASCNQLYLNNVLQVAGSYGSTTSSATNQNNTYFSGNYVICVQNPAPTNLACYETSTWNAANCQYDITGTQPAQPTLACYQAASFNTTTCVWDVTGTQPAQPTLACYETASFNTTTCAWDVTGTMPAQPSLLCYQTASFNSNTCSWVVTGTPPVVTANTAVLCPGSTSTVTLVGTPTGGTFSVPNPYSGATPATYTYTYTDPATGCVVSATGTILLSSVAPANIITPIAVSTTSATVSWNSVPGSSIYYVWYKPVTAPASAWLTPSTTATSLNLTGLLPNTQYEVKIRNNNAACNQFGVFGLPVNFTTLNQPCIQPTTISAAVVPTNKLKFNWVAVAGATQYNIWYKNLTTGIQYSFTRNAPFTTFTTATTPAGVYEYKIRNRCSPTALYSAFSPNQTIVVGGSAKGADLALTSSINMYPNPTTDILNIELNAVEAANALVKVYDLTGRLMQTVQSNVNVGVNQITLSMSEYAAGVYTVQVFENGILTQVNRVRKND